jgi:predicted ATP-dependent serine protease
MYNSITTYVCKECGKIFQPCGGCPNCYSRNVTPIFNCLTKEQLESFIEGERI